MKNLQKGSIGAWILVLIVLAIIVCGAYLYFFKAAATESSQGSASISVGTISPSATAGWYAYTNPDLGISFDYPENYGIPSLDTYGENIFFSPDGKSAYIDISMLTWRDMHDGHIQTVAELTALDHPTTPVSVDGKPGLAYTGDDPSTDVAVGDGRIFTTNLNPQIPVDKQILDTVKFIAREPQPDFRLGAYTSIDTIAHPGATRIDYSIRGNDIEAASWNGKWSLEIDCPSGVTSFSYGSTINCNAVTPAGQWTVDTNPGAWFMNSTGQTQQVKAIARLLDDKGDVVATDSATVDVQPQRTTTASAAPQPAPASANNGDSVYSDPDGFSFRYPASMKIVASAGSGNGPDGGKIVKEIALTDTTGNVTWVDEVAFTQNSLTTADGGCQATYSYNANAGNWMVAQSGCDGAQTVLYDHSQDTASGLPVLWSQNGISSVSYYVPLKQTSLSQTLLIMPADRSSIGTDIVHSVSATK